jgi:hypothetical protein
MTRASPARISRRRLGGGRPRLDPRTDPDIIKVEFGVSLKAAWKISERKAFDLVVAHFESRAVTPSRTPHGPGMLVGYETTPLRTVSGRASVLRHKIKYARPDVVAALTVALRCRDFDAAVRLFDGLNLLAAVATPDRVRRIIEQLLNSG